LAEQYLWRLLVLKVVLFHGVFGPHVPERVQDTSLPDEQAIHVVVRIEFLLVRGETRLVQEPIKDGVTELHIGVCIQDNFVPCLLDQGRRWEGGSEVDLTVWAYTLELIRLVVD